MEIAIPKEQVVFLISGISCLDCAGKFEKEVASLPGVETVRLNAVTGKLAVEGVIDTEAIQNVAFRHDYKAQVLCPQPEKTSAVFTVTGITCLDCARKFEIAVNALPGVVKANLNTVTGKLTVEGTADIEAIRDLGQEEGYTIEPGVSPAKQDQAAGTNWGVRRAVGSAAALAAAYIAETLVLPAGLVLPLYAVATLLGGWANFIKAVRSLQHFSFTMSVLMSVAVAGAFAIGQYEEGATVAFLFSVSELLESWTVERARHSIRSLMELAPATAVVRRDGREYELAAEEVVIGDVLVVRPGEKIAMDGVVISGYSPVNQAAITGESIPVEKGPGAEVFAGTLNLQGSLEVEVTKKVQDTAIAKVIQMVEEAQSKRAPSQAMAEKFAAVYTPVVMVLAAGIIVVPPVFLGQEWAPWIYRGLSLMVVACPCALVISTPVAIISAISTAARYGVLIKGGIYLEETAAITAVAFDKTGTLTEGKPRVTELMSADGISEEFLLNSAASLEMRSEHPLAAAIVQAAEQRGLAVEPAESFTAIPGRGGKGLVGGQTVYAGNPELFAELGLLRPEYRQRLEILQEKGQTVVLVGSEQKLYGMIALADALRTESSAMLKALKQAGIRFTVMLTGDNAKTAAMIGAQAGVDAVKAGLLPQDKVAAVEDLKRQYGKIAMIGDGINDAPALAAASLGIAMGGAGTDTAMEAADIVLMGDDLSKLPFAVRLSRRALTVIRQNISFSLAIKALAVLAVFPGWLTLWLAILADMGATILVTLNSLRLLRERPQTIK